MYIFIISVRLYDIVRYKNFRAFIPKKVVQFTCVAIDPSGEVIAAGTMHTYEIYLWSVKANELIDILGGHEAPISHIQFSKKSPHLFSSSYIIFES